MIEAVFEAGLKSGFSVTEVFQEKTERKEYESFGGPESVHQAETDRLIVRAFWDTGDPVGFVLSAIDQKNVGRNFSQIRSLVKPDRKKNYAHLLPREIQKTPLDIYDHSFANVKDEQVREMRERVNEAMISLPGLKVARFSFSKALRKIHIANSHGLLAKYKKSLFCLSLTFSLRDNLVDLGETRVFVDQINPERLVSRAFNLIGSITENQKVDARSESIILSPEAAALVLREFSDHLKMGGGIAKRNEIVASDKLNVVDHPLLGQLSGSVPFDDEGVQSGEKYLINKGYSIVPVSDIRTAFVHRKNSSGNGFRDERGIFPAIQFSNLFIKPTSFSLGNLMREARRGILVSLLKVKESGWGKGAYLFSAHGFQFQNEEIGEPVHFYLRTSFPTFAVRIEKISKELRFFHARFNIGSPYVLIRGKFNSEKIFCV